jgi:hypothetical protein
MNMYAILMIGIGLVLTIAFTFWGCELEKDRKALEKNLEGDE